MTSISPRRFVIVHHKVGSKFKRTNQDHFDWMFQTGESLTTFATPVVSDLDSDFQIPCQPLPEHRIEYLDFEGVIPDRGERRDRGSVVQIASGRFEMTMNTNDCFLAKLLFGPVKIGTAMVEFQRAEPHWNLRYFQYQAG